VSGDLDSPTPNTASFIVANKTGGTLSQPTVGPRTSAITTATGLSTFSDFLAGEPVGAAKLLVTLPGQTFTGGGGNSGV
jgi:hypothetical protein